MKKSIKGFTIMEVMIAMAILTTIMGISLAALTANETYRDLVAIRVQLYRQNKRALDVITEELRRSRPNFTIPISNGPPPYYGVAFQVPLVNNISTDGNFTVPWGATSGSTSYPGYYIFYVWGGPSARTVIRSIWMGPANGSFVAGADEIKATDIVNLEVINNTASYYTIRVTSSRNMTLSPARQLNATSEASVYLMN